MYVYINYTVWYSSVGLILGYLMSVCSIVYQNFLQLLSGCLSLLSECSLFFSAFRCPVLFFLFLFFSLVLPFFPSFCPLSIRPFILVVSPDLLLLRPTRQDHRDQFSTTRQHLSSYCIRHGSERPLSSCLLLPKDGEWWEPCACACMCMFCTLECLDLWKMPPNKKQMSNRFKGWQ